MCIRCSFTSENSVQVIDFACAALRANRRLYLATICSTTMGAFQVPAILRQAAPLARGSVATIRNICTAWYSYTLQNTILIVQLTGANATAKVI